jgi:ligand-binding sensor domain-containing protein
VLDVVSSGESVWAATAAGLVRIEAFGMHRAVPAGVARLLAPAQGGQVFALYATGILRVGETVEERIDLPVDPARAQADAMDAMPDGTILLRIGGAGYARPPGGEWRREGDGPAPRAGTEHQGETWVATRGRGILRRRHVPYFRSVPLPRTPRVHALARSPDGTIWCGTNDGLAAVLPDGTVEETSRIGEDPLGVVTACAVDGDGRVWIGSGSSFRGVYRREDGAWHHLDAIDGYVHRITVDPSGALWFSVLNAEGEPSGSGNGAWCFADGEFRPAPLNVDLPSGRIYDVVARDRRGTLWFATLKGLAAYEGARVVRYVAGEPGLLGEKVWCLCAARDGALWIGYQQTPGVSRLAHGIFTHFDVDDGLCDGSVWSITEGKPGVLWFATGSGLSRYDGIVWSSFRNEEGLGEEAIWPLLPMADGSLWIGTLGRGVVHLDPRDRTPPRTRFKADAYEAAEGSAVEIAWTGADAWYDTPAAELRYRSRLDGGRWSPATPAMSVRTSPPAGEHTLEVQAIDRFGNVEDPPATVRLVVAGPMRIPYALAAGAAAALLAAGFLVGRARRKAA